MKNIFWVTNGQFFFFSVFLIFLFFLAFLNIIFIIKLKIKVIRCVILYKENYLITSNKKMIFHKYIDNVLYKNIN